MQIGRKDVVWNFAATSLRIASGVIVLPISLRMLSNETIGLWGIFLTIGSITPLLDFGFSSSFSRNITYIFSGAKQLKAKGYNIVGSEDSPIDYGLLKSVIRAMRYYYGILSLAFIFIFLIIGTPYLYTLLQKYNGNPIPIQIAWFLYGFLIAYQLYTYYYDSLLQGRGYIKQSKQIIVIGQTIQCVTIIFCLLLKLDLLSMVIGLFLNVIVSRALMYIMFYDKQLKNQLSTAVVLPVKNIMKILAPNSIKLGISSVCGFLISKATMLIAPVFLPLAIIGTYSITRQMVDLIASIGNVWYSTYYVKMTHYRIRGENDGLKRLYLKSLLWLFGVFLVCGIGLLLIGQPLFDFIHSKTHLLACGAISMMLFFSVFDVNSSFSTALISMKNEVPYVKSSIITAFVTLILLSLFLCFTDFGVWGMILAPALAQAIYQDWKWPLYVKKDLNVRMSDFRNVLWSILSKHNV
jgi:O-antigen/teichoic acid export membrane protein